jgi:hypothetical protein
MSAVPTSVYVLSALEVSARHLGGINEYASPDSPPLPYNLSRCTVSWVISGTRIFENTLREATIFVETKKNDDLHRALVDYG